MFPLMFGLVSMSPEALSAQVLMSPGPGPLTTAAAAYRAVSTALSAAAAGSDSSMGAMQVAWRGPSADRAQNAFRNHTEWLRTQSDAAGATQVVLMSLADAAAVVQVEMTAIHAELDVFYSTVLPGAVATSLMTQNVAPLAAAESFYEGIRAQAAAAYSAYSACAMSALGALPAPTPAPAIVSGAPLTPPALGLGSGLVDPGIVGMNGVTPSPTVPGGNGDIGPGGEQGANAEGPPPNSNGAGSDGPGGEQSGTAPATDTADRELAVPESRDGKSLADSAGDTGVDGSTALPDRTGYYGTSLNSSTLVGLNGGMGSTVSLAMMRGGLGAVPGSATGYRIPANWSASPVRTFGAGTGATPTAQPLSGRTPPRGVSSSGSRLRRRRNGGDRSGRVFLPGESQDALVLEPPPPMGVLDHADEEGQGVSASERLLGVGRSANDSVGGESPPE